MQHLSHFKKKSKTVIWHIPHQYSSEMATKSTIVILHKHAMLDDTITILIGSFRC